MLHVKIAQLQAELASFLRKVKAGESVTVYDGETPIARIDPPVAEAPPVFKTNDKHLASLIARGIVLPPKNPNPDWSFLNEPLPKAEVSVLEALLEERREGR
jgi:antitoxin (DNA-binding transcriptional repressor) of toxin-antitoxin stability system